MARTGVFVLVFYVLKRPISSFAGKPSMILVLLRHTPNPSSKFIDLGVEIPCARGTLVKFESTLYGGNICGATKLNPNFF
jgi:hypothetical protein